MWLVPSMPTARQSAGDGRPDRLRRARARKALRNVHRAALPQDPEFSPPIAAWTCPNRYYSTFMHPTVWLHGHGLQHVAEALSAGSAEHEISCAGVPCTVLADTSLAYSRRLAQPSIDTVVSGQCAN
jgi:hypothetical protein